MKKGTCYIVGAGDFTARDFHPAKGDLVIAADGGADSLAAHGLRPHLLIGDMDSVIAAPNVPRIKFPKIKNDTDLSLAIKVGIKIGYRSFHLYGIGGGRPDHFYANLQLMAMFSAMGLALHAVLPECDIWSVTNGTLLVPSHVGQTVSVFCPDGLAKGVTMSGLFYPLQDAVLSARFPLGVSNEAVSKQIKISVRQGTLIVFLLQS